jgi:hypothetical protein
VVLEVVLLSSEKRGEEEMVAWVVSEGRALGETRGERCLRCKKRRAVSCSGTAREHRRSYVRCCRSSLARVLQLCSFMACARLLPSFIEQDGLTWTWLPPAAPGWLGLLDCTRLIRLIMCNGFWSEADAD